MNMQRGTGNIDCEKQILREIRKAEFEERYSLIISMKDQVSDGIRNKLYDIIEWYQSRKAVLNMIHDIKN